MSAIPVGSSEQDGRRGASVAGRSGPEGRTLEQGSDHEGTSEAAVAGQPVVVRRNAGLAALVGYAASGVAIAYLWRASQTMTVLDWALFGVMSVIAAIYLASLVDARTPLLVADDLGVRIRLGNEWRGLPWEAIGQVVVHPRRSRLQDGRLVFVPRSLARAVEGLDARARRHVAMNQKMYGAALAVPLGSTTRVSASGDPASLSQVPDVAPSGGPSPDAAAPDGSGSPERRIAEGISALALGRAEVIVVEPRRDEDEQQGPSGSAGTEKSAGAGSTGAPAQPAAEDGSESTSGGEDHGGDEQADAAPASRVVFPALRGGTPWGWSRSGTAREGNLDPVEAGADDTAPTGGETDHEVSPTDDLGGGDAQVTLGDGMRAARASGRSILGGIGTIISRVAKGRLHDVDQDAGPGVEQTEPSHTPAATPAPDPASHDATDQSPAETGLVADGPSAGDDHLAGGLPPARGTAALRETRPALRAEATLDSPPSESSAALDAATRGNAADRELPEGRELRRPGSVDLVFERVEVEDRVRPISTLGDAVDPLVIDDYVTEPAYDPVIGPELTAARTRLGLSVDDLAERTRIRPHVIESIEVDDFAPCGGDFYARGHLRTLARILGKDVEPLLARFEERYATAPINARRVFEAELATGMTGSMRSTIGGPSWGLLIGVVLCLVLVWGVLRLFTTEPSDVQAPVVHGAAWVVGAHAAPSSPPALS